MYVGIHTKYPSFLPDFHQTCIFTTDFLKILKHKISQKSAQWEQTSLWTDRHNEANGHFS